MLNIAFRRFIDNLGIPASLNAFLEQGPDMGYALAQRPTVSTSSITRWQDWAPSGWCSAPGELRGWRLLNGQYQGVGIRIDSFTGICEKQTYSDWQCDIRDVEVLSASKSPLELYDDLDRFAEVHCDGYLDDPTPSCIDDNLAHREVRIVQPDGVDFFAYYDWDGRICLINCGGSHHFSTARYLSKVARHPVTLHGRLDTYSLNPLVVSRLHAQFVMFSIRYDLLLWNELFEALRALRATFFMGELPTPHLDGRVLLLPRGEPRSMIAEHTLANAGFFDLGAHLLTLLNKQTGYPERV